METSYTSKRTDLQRRGSRRYRPAFPPSPSRWQRIPLAVIPFLLPFLLLGWMPLPSETLASRPEAQLAQPFTKIAPEEAGFCPERLDRLTGTLHDYAERQRLSGGVVLGLRGVPGAVGDFGWGGAYHSTYWVSPQDRLVVVFFTQLIPSRGSDVHGKLRTMLYQALTDP